MSHEVPQFSLTSCLHVAEPADAEVKQAAAMVKAAGNADVRKSRLVELFYSCDTNK